MFFARVAMKTQAIRSQTKKKPHKRRFPPILTLKRPHGRFFFPRRMVSATIPVMTKPYGKRPKQNTPKSAAPKSDNASFKIKLRGKDGAPLSMDELQQGLFEIARKLKSRRDIRAKWVTLYLTAIDEHGETIVLDPKGLIDPTFVQFTECTDHVLCPANYLECDQG